MSLTARAVKDFQKLDKATQKRLASKIREYSDDPIRHARKLNDASMGSYRFRIGDWRVVFDLHDDEVMVLRIGNRRDIYR